MSASKITVFRRQFLHAASARTVPAAPSIAAVGGTVGRSDARATAAQPMKFTRSALVIAGLLGCVALVTACGELPQTALYEQGHYRGKPDAQPWDGEAFRGDRVEWDKAVTGRTANQNEYARMSN